MRSNILCFLLATLALVSLCGSARAWGDNGHKIICEIAFRLAQPDTRSAVRRLIQSDAEFSTFADSCVFPDHPRRRASEHFINLPRNSKGLADYCETDVVNTYRVWLRYELFRGKLDEDGFRASEHNLIEFIKRHENTKQHLSEVVAGRLL
jgi:hypothetical protein